MVLKPSNPSNTFIITEEVSVAAESIGSRLSGSDPSAILMLVGCAGVAVAAAGAALAEVPAEAPAPAQPENVSTAASRTTASFFSRIIFMLLLLCCLVKKRKVNLFI